MPKPKEPSPEAIVDFVERVRIELTTVDPDDRLNALETVTHDLENGLGCIPACADALLSYALANLQTGRNQQYPWIARLRSLSEAGGSRRNSTRDNAVAAITIYWSRDLVNHYKFIQMGRTMAGLLQKVALRYNQWSQAKDLMNAAFLFRQRKHLSTDDLVLEWAEKGIVIVGDRELLVNDSDAPQELADYVATWISGDGRSTIDEQSEKSTCSHRACYDLVLDAHGLIVPGMAPTEPALQDKRKQHDNPSPRRKRTRTRRNAGQSARATSAATEELSVAAEQPSQSVPVNVDNVVAPCRDHLGERRYSNTPDDQAAEAAGGNRRDSGHSELSIAIANDPTNLGAELSHEVRNNNLRRSSRLDRNVMAQAPSVAARPHTSGKRPGLRPVALRSQSPPQNQPFASLNSSSPEQRHTSQQPRSQTSTPPKSPAPTFSDLVSSTPIFSNPMSAPVTMSFTPAGGPETTAQRTYSGQRSQQAARDSHSYEAELLPSESLYRDTGDQYMYSDGPLFVTPPSSEGIQFATGAEANPIFENDQDNAARLFSPELTALEEESTRKRDEQLADAQYKAAGISKRHCKQLEPWASSMRLAKVYHGIQQPQDNGTIGEEVNSLDFTSLVDTARATPVTKPTIITGPFSHPPASLPQQWRTESRVCVGAQIQIEGDTWLRSLSGSHCCMVVLEPESATADPANFNPYGHSGAIMLDEGDILWMPPHMSYAAITLEAGTMQAGRLIDNRVDPTFGALDVERLLAILQVILHHSTGQSS